MSNYPKDVKLRIIEENYWIGLGKQELDFHQALGELIDNCISATALDDEKDMIPFKIEIQLEQKGDLVEVNIVDNGIGMSEKELIDEIFSPGGRGNNSGALNEHGFGLKHSLCVLTAGNKLDWTIITRDSDALMRDEIYKVSGPFSLGMKLELATKDELTNNNFFNIPQTGTRINFETTFDYFSTIYNRGRVFNTLVDRLMEHLGVMYREYLKSDFNKLNIYYKNSDEIWERRKILPIEICYDSSGCTEYTIEVWGDRGSANAIYRVGKLDKEATVNKSTEKPYPLKIYYQGNQSTQGVDLVVRGRVIKPHLLTEIWGKERHNTANEFTGEIILTDSRFKTVNNKTALDPNDLYTINLFHQLREENQYRIESVTNKRTEDEYTKIYEIRLKSMFRGSTVNRNHPIFSGSGVKIDLYLKEKNGDITIHEFKAKTATPIDVYQLLMYWDGVVKDENKSPICGILVANKIPGSVRNIISDANKRNDALGNAYYIESKTLEDLDLN